MDNTELEFLELLNQLPLSERVEYLEHLRKLVEGRAEDKQEDN